MSKIAEQKALEAYPPCINSNGFDLAESRREGCIKGYDLAFQYFMEKAESFIENKVSDYFWWNQEECFVEFDKEECLKQFKNYMQYEK
jgi:hypothetical protein